MTERWQQELGKLRTIEPSGDGWRRAETQTPGGDGLPPPRQRLTAAVVAFAVFAAAGLFLVRSFDRGQEGDLGASKGLGGSHVVVTATSAQDEDAFGAITLMVDGADVPGVGGTAGTWPVGDGDEHPIGYPTQRLDRADFVKVTAGATLELAGDADTVETVAHVGDDPEGAETLSIDPSSFSTLVPGYYVLRVEASWATPTTETWSSKLFPIEIVEAPADGALSTLAGTEWRLTALDGQPIHEDDDRLGGASIEFKESMFGGWSGCNSFGGKYQTDGSSFSVGGIRGTQVGPCSGEESWFARLGSADSWTSDGSTLTVSGPAGSFTAVRVGREPIDVLRVECLPGSTQVLDRQVVATAQGVAGIFGPAGHAKRVEFAPVAASAGSETEVSLGDELTEAAVPLVPGDWEVRCAGWSEEIRPVEITVLPEQQTSTSPGEAVPDVGDPALPDVLRVRCTEAGAEVLTPEVAARAGGLHVEATPGSADHADGIELRPLGWPVVNFSSGSSGIEGAFVRAVPEGEVIVSCYRGDDGGRITPGPQDGEAIARVMDPADFYTPWIPACALMDQVAFDGGERFDLAGLEGADAVRALIPAVRPGDDVARGGYGNNDTFERSLFSVTRSGTVIGSVWIDSDTGGTWIASGFACAGSGIEDGLDTYPAWEGSP